MIVLRQISENIQFTKKVLKEANGEKRNKYYIKGVFIQPGIANRNKREYPEEIVEKEVERYNKENIDTHRAYGELGHPELPSIQLDRVSHMILSLVKEGKDYVGKANVLDTPNGKIVKELIDAGASLGVSSRGVGSLEKKGDIDVVQSDYKLITAADIVADPSAPDAYVTAVMEQKEWVWKNGVFTEKEVSDQKKKILKTPSRDLDEVKLRIFEKFLSKL